MTDPKPIKHAPEAGRFYDLSGNIIPDRIPMTTKEGLRPITIRDARTNGWLPSFSNISGYLGENKGLVRWQKEQAIRACIDNPRTPIEPLEAYIGRMQHASGAYTRLAADRGTLMHKEVEKYFVNGTQPVDDACVKAVRAIDKWLRGKRYGDVRCESTFVRPDLGYASTCDFHSGDFIADFKTKSKSGMGDMSFKYGLQLSCYRTGLSLGDVPMYTIFINRDTGDVLIKQWGKDTNKYTEADLDKAFNMTFECWCLQNDYDPRVR